MNIPLWKSLSNTYYNFFLDLVKLGIYVCGSPSQIHLTTLLDLVKLWICMFVELFSKCILLLLLDLVKLWIYVCGRPCKIHLTTLLDLVKLWIYVCRSLFQIYLTLFIRFSFLNFVKFTGLFNFYTTPAIFNNVKVVRLCRTCKFRNFVFLYPGRVLCRCIRSGIVILKDKW